MENLKLSVNENDISSYGNFDKIQQKEIHLDLTIDFSKQIVKGSSTIVFSILDQKEKRVVLDTKGLIIHRIVQEEKNLDFSLYTLNTDKEALGTPLVIHLNREHKVGEEVSITIFYESTSESAAIQWFNKDQTFGKEHPFMYTQCEAILARTLVPCQDSPSVKVRVTADLTIEKPLIALFGGIEISSHDIDNNKKTYKYIQKIPIPTYLIAIACGDMEYGKISERTGVWTERGLKDRAVYEFAGTEEILKVAENYLTPYSWEIYNILVLPAAFPYGGMENPNLTFVNFALLAGDRSMINVIAHEIIHSWTGNLVTNKDWTMFWMNEGFTKFLERKISELMEGEDMANLQARVGFSELQYAISSIGENHSFTSLNPDFRGVDPDDGFSVVPYEKGATLLYYLETLVGKQNFQLILKNYIINYSLKSISQYDWQETFIQHVKELYSKNDAENILNKIDWEAWYTKPGLPIITHEYRIYYFKNLFSY